jgi:hypothetical protein
MIEFIRGEAAQPDAAFAVFETEIPERAAIAEALGKTGKFPTFTDKWGEEVVGILSKLADETRRLLHGR